MTRAGQRARPDVAPASRRNASVRDRAGVPRGPFDETTPMPRGQLLARGRRLAWRSRSDTLVVADTRGVLERGRGEALRAADARGVAVAAVAELSASRRLAGRLPAVLPAAPPRVLLAVAVLALALTAVLFRGHGATDVDAGRVEARALAARPFTAPEPDVLCAGRANPLR